MPTPLEITSDVIAIAKKAGADAADCLYYRSASLSLSRRMGQPEGIERSESSGISLRVFAGKRPAMVSSSDSSPNALQEMAERAVKMARLSPEDPFAALAPQPLLATSFPELELHDVTQPGEAWLLEQCAKAEDAALSVQGITNSEGADASHGETDFALATSNGFRGGYKTSSSTLSVSVLAGSGTGMERDYDFSSRRFLNELKDAGELGKNAAARALARLGARKIATAMMPVVFDPRVSKGLVSAFAGAINGSAIARGTSFLKDSLGKTVFGNGIRIIDNPHLVRGLGSRPFDGEGVANRPAYLIENGILQGWLLDMRSAAKLGLTTTGHANRGLSSPPSPATSNLYMQSGTHSPEELIQDIKQGFYVTEVFGMGVNLITGDYSQGAAGFMIENGQKTFAVSEVTIAGKLQDMFLRLTPASDLNFTYATNAPTVRVEGMTVAGKV